MCFWYRPRLAGALGRIVEVTLPDGHKLLGEESQSRQLNQTSLPNREERSGEWLATRRKPLSTALPFVNWGAQMLKKVRTRRKWTVCLH